MKTQDFLSVVARDGTPPAVPKPRRVSVGLREDEPVKRPDYIAWLRDGALESVSAGWRRTFLRLSFCANLLFSRFFSPGFRKKECFLTSLIMPSC